MSHRRHVNDARMITSIFELINFLGVFVGCLAAIVVLFADFPEYSGPVASIVLLLLTFVWWFLNKLAYIGLQLLTDITELLSESSAHLQLEGR